MRRWRLILSVVAMATMVAGLRYFLSGRHEAETTFMRYHGEQPELGVHLLPGSTDEADVPEILRAASEFFAGHGPMPEDLWHDAFWWVCWQRKAAIHLVDGDEVVCTSIPDGLSVRVEKGTLDCSFGSSR